MKNKHSDSESPQLSRRQALAMGVLAPLVAAPQASVAATQEEGDETQWSRAQNAFSDRKFGIFVHWGPASVGARELGWGRKAFRPGVSTAPYIGSNASDPYYDTLYRRFMPAADFAPNLAKVIKASGAKYATLTAKHHDGYPLFRTKTIAKSAYSDFASTHLGRSGRDLCAEFADAIRDAGLSAGFYYSQQDWTQPDYVKANYAAYLPYMKQQLEELLTGYGPLVDLFYDSLPDGPIATFDPPWLTEQPRKWQPQIAINNRAYSRWTDNLAARKAFPRSLRGDYDTPEGEIGAFQVYWPWATCMTITNLWGWQPDSACMSTEQIIQTLVKCATGGGNLLLNIGPDPMGYIEDNQVASLTGVGNWLASAGEAIFATRAGPFVRNEFGGSTYRDATVYVQIFSERTGGIKPKPGEALKPIYAPGQAKQLILPKIDARLVEASTLDGSPLTLQSHAHQDVVVIGDRSWTPPVIICKLRYDRAISNRLISPFGIGLR